MVMRIAPLLILLSLLTGCAVSRSDDVLIQEALQERADAYVRVAKAITHYCEVSTGTLAAKEACILERRLSLLEVK